jgi:hypothetical protein
MRADEAPGASGFWIAHLLGTFWAEK